MSIDWAKYLEANTSSTGWSDADGPDSGVGESYWYGADDGRFARLSVDQGEASLDIMPEDGEDEEESLWTGNLADAAEDPEFAPYLLDASGPPSPRLKHSMSRKLTEHPTLRDLFVQGLGVNRCMCPDPLVMETRRWDAWMALATAASDERLVELRKVEFRFTALMFVNGHLGRWQEERMGTFETRDVYRTPGVEETELSRLLHTRRTEGRLRELVAADAAAAAGSFRRYAADGRLAKMAEVAGPGPFDAGPLPTAETFDAMSDWDLKDEWVSLRMRTAFYEMYDRSLEMKAAETLAEMTQGSPTL